MFKVELLVAHALFASEKAGAKAALLGTLQATWLSTAGLWPAIKLQVRPLLQGREPFTGYMLPPSWY